MRHLYANLAVYVLAGSLLLLSMLFAWIRSDQLILATETSVEPPGFAEAVEPDDFPWREIGERVYVGNCQTCHGASGTGRDVYPPVVGQGAVVEAEGGREYLIRVMLYGLATGTHGAPMPPMPHLSDTQIAAVNNFMLTRFEHPARPATDLPLFVPSEVAAERGRRLRERDVAAMRPDVPSPRELARIE